MFSSQSPAANASLFWNLQSPPKRLGISDIPFPGLFNIEISQLLSWGLHSYAQVMCFFGLLAFFKTYFGKLQSLLEDHFTSTLHVKATDETYDMLLAWASSRGLNNLARSIIARVGTKWKSRHSLSMNGKKPICISPWNGGFWFRFKGKILSYQIQSVSNGLHKEEVITITCLGRSVQVLKDLIEECRVEYLKQGQNKMSIFKNCGDYWKKTTTKDKRPLSTIITSETQKQDLVEDVKEFLDPETQTWYAGRGIPYRRGYLLYGPPGTGKSSLVSAVAGEFDLDIRTISIPSVDDNKLEDLFDSLPERCVVLLEDVDAVDTDRSQYSDASEKKKKGTLSLSGLLNTLDGVASQEGRILFMTTNHKDKLDDALIRPGRIDRKFEIKLADKTVTRDLFRFIFRQREHFNPQFHVKGKGTKNASHPPQENVPHPWPSLIKDLFRFVLGVKEDPFAQKKVLDERETPDKDHVARGKARATGDRAINRLAAKFATKIPEFEFSAAQIMCHLLQHRKSPKDALKYASNWVDITRKDMQMMCGTVEPKLLLSGNSEPLKEGLWMKPSNKKSPVTGKLRRVGKFSDLHLTVPVSPPPSPCDSACQPGSASTHFSLSTVGDTVVCTTSVPLCVPTDTQPNSVTCTEELCGETKRNSHSHIDYADKDFLLNDGACEMNEADRHRFGIQDWSEENSSSTHTNRAAASTCDLEHALSKSEPQVVQGVLHQAGVLKAIYVKSSIEQTFTSNTGAAANSTIRTDIKALRPGSPLADGCTLLPCDLGSPFVPFKSHPVEATVPEGPELDSSDFPVTLWDATQDVPAGSDLEKMSGEERLKLGINEPDREDKSHDISIIPWTDCCPNDPDMAREQTLSTGVPGIRVYPANVFFHDSDSQSLNAVDASQSNDESRAKIETQISHKDSEIEIQAFVRTRNLTGLSDSNAVINPVESWDTTKDVPASSGFCNCKQGDLLESDMEDKKSTSNDELPRAKVVQQTGEQRKMGQGVDTMGEFKSMPAGSVTETQNTGSENIKFHAYSVNASSNPEVLGSGEITQYFNPSDLPAEWGTEEGIDINSLLGDLNEDKFNQPENVLDRHDLSAVETGLPSHVGDVDMDFVLDDGATDMSEDDQHRIRKCWLGVKSPSTDITMASAFGSDDRDRVQETEPKGGSGVQHPTRMAIKSITVTTSIERVVTPNTGAAEHSKFRTEVKAMPPSNPDNTNDDSSLTPVSMTSDGNGPTSTPSKSQIGVAQVWTLPTYVDSLRTMKSSEGYPLFTSDLDGLSQDDTRPTVCGPGSCNVGQLFDHQNGHSLNDLFDQNKNYGGMDANHGLPLMSECVSEHNTEEAPAKNKTQPETRGSSSTPAKASSFSAPSLSAVGTPVSKLCTPASVKTDVQVELAVETEKPRDASEAKDVAEIHGIDVDFDLDCGARKITEEDFVRLGLHNLSWPKLGDTITGPPPMSTADLGGLENASKESPLLVSGANAKDDSEENVVANKTALDVGIAKLLVANVDSLLSMKLDPPIDFFGGISQQTSPRGTVPDGSPVWKTRKADGEHGDEPQTNDSSNTHDVNSSDSADESVWVKVEVGTDNLATYTDM